MVQEAEQKKLKKWREEQTKQLDIAWAKVDVDLDGSLDAAELGTVFGALGQKVDAEALLLQFDQDGDGKVDKDEFFEWWCTRSVADKERLKGEAPAASERVLKLKTKFKLAAMFAGRPLITMHD